jgi:processive 1,2-diacylglycerol beta-glucosyltransferase
MKILITYVSAGAGHFRAAQAVYRYIKENCPRVEVELVDILEKTNGFFRFFYKGSYSFLIRRSPFVWKALFWLTDFKPTATFIRPLGFIIDLFSARAFIRFLITNQFDCIFSTHFFPAEIATYLKRTGKINSRLVTLITDFGVHSYWVSQGTDRYMVATEVTRDQLTQKNVPVSLITVSGIPVDKAFLKQGDRMLWHKKFNTDKDRFTVLIGAGSFGIGPIEKLAALLHKDVQILVVCGRNNRLYKSLKQKEYPGVYVFGFVDYMDELMSVADLIITKAGGMTIAESLAKNLAPLFMMVIPGQERENVKVLSLYGIGPYTRNPVEVKDRVLDFKQHPQKLDSIKKNINKIKHPSALEEVCRVVCTGRAGCAC